MAKGAEDNDEGGDGRSARGTHLEDGQAQLTRRNNANNAKKAKRSKMKEEGCDNPAYNSPNARRFSRQNAQSSFDYSHKSLKFSDRNQSSFASSNTPFLRDNSIQSRSVSPPSVAPTFTIQITSEGHTSPVPTPDGPGPPTAVPPDTSSYRTLPPPPRRRALVSDRPTSMPPPRTPLASPSDPQPTGAASPDLLGYVQLQHISQRSSFASCASSSADNPSAGNSNRASRDCSFELDMQVNRKRDTETAKHPLTPNTDAPSAAYLDAGTGAERCVMSSSTSSSGGSSPTRVFASICLQRSLHLQSDYCLT